MHIPIGLLIGIPVLGWPIAYLFVFYERNEDRHLRDGAWMDVFGALIGASISSCALLVLLATWLWRA